MLLVAHHKCSSVAILARRLFLHQGFLPLASVPPSNHHALETPELRRFPPPEMAAATKMSRPCMTPSEKGMGRHMYHNLKKNPSENTRVPLEETSRTQVRPAGSARAAHVVQIRRIGRHGGRLRVPLQGIPWIQVRAAGGAGAAPVARIRLKGNHKGHVRVPLEGIPLIQVRPARIAGGALSCAGAPKRGDGSRARASLGGNVKGGRPIVSRQKPNSQKQTKKYIIKKKQIIF